MGAPHSLSATINGVHSNRYLAYAQHRSHAISGSIITKFKCRFVKKFGSSAIESVSFSIEWFSFALLLTVFGQALAVDVMLAGGQVDEGITAHLDQSFQCHIAGSLDSPFVVLLKQDGTVKTYDCGLVLKYYDHICLALDLAVEAFQWIGAVQLRPVLCGEADVGHHICLCTVIQNGELGQLRPKLIRNGVQQLSNTHRIILREGRCDECGDLN